MSIARRALNLHLLSHIGYKQFACFKCGQTFSKRNAFINHFHRQKEILKMENQENQCKICFKYFPTVALKNEHERDHNKTGKGINSKCPFCPHVSRVPAELKRHILYKHKNRPEDRKFNCIYCRKTFKSQTDKMIHEYAQHELLENRDSTFNCPKCKFSSRSLANISQHIKLDHEERGHFESTENSTMNSTVATNHATNCKELGELTPLHSSPTSPPFEDKLPTLVDSQTLDGVSIDKELFSSFTLLPTDIDQSTSNSHAKSWQNIFKTPQKSQKIHQNTKILNPITKMTPNKMSALEQMIENSENKDEITGQIKPDRVERIARYVCHVCGDHFKQGRYLTKHLVNVHRFEFISRAQYRKNEVDQKYYLVRKDSMIADLPTDQPEPKTKKPNEAQIKLPPKRPISATNSEFSSASRSPVLLYKKPKFFEKALKISSNEPKLKPIEPQKKRKIEYNLKFKNHSEISFDIVREEKTIDGPVFGSINL